MSLSKYIGTLVGFLLGVTISALYVIGGTAHHSLPAVIVIATILLGSLLGAAIGAFIGSDDRRR